MVTDLAEVFRLGTAKAKENLEFRRYLSSHHHGGEEFPILASEVAEQIDCTGCANCCRYSSVTVEHSEIEAIAGYLGDTVENITRLYTEPASGAPALRSLKSNQAGCVFLDGNLCTIYEARPKACREFPHVAIGVHSLGARQSSHARWAPLCPIVYNALERYKHVTGYTAAQR